MIVFCALIAACAAVQADKKHGFSFVLFALSREDKSLALFQQFSRHIVLPEHNHEEDGGLVLGVDAATGGRKLPPRVQITAPYSDPHDPKKLQREQRRGLCIARGILLPLMLGIERTHRRLFDAPSDIHGLLHQDRLDLHGHGKASLRDQQLAVFHTARLAAQTEEAATKREGQPIVECVLLAGWLLHYSTLLLPERLVTLAKLCRLLRGEDDATLRLLGKALAVTVAAAFSVIDIRTSKLMQCIRMAQHAIVTCRSLDMELIAFALRPLDSDADDMLQFLCDDMGKIAKGTFSSAKWSPAQLNAFTTLQHILLSASSSKRGNSVLSMWESAGNGQRPSGDFRLQIFDEDNMMVAEESVTQFPSISASSSSSSFLRPSGSASHVSFRKGFRFGLSSPSEEMLPRQSPSPTVPPVGGADSTLTLPTLAALDEPDLALPTLPDASIRLPSLVTSSGVSSFFSSSGNRLSTAELGDSGRASPIDSSEAFSPSHNRARVSQRSSKKTVLLIHEESRSGVAERGGKKSLSRRSSLPRPHSPGGADSMHGGVPSVLFVPRPPKSPTGEIWAADPSPSSAGRSITPPDEFPDFDVHRRLRSLSSSGGDVAIVSSLRPEDTNRRMFLRVSSLATGAYTGLSVLSDASDAAQSTKAPSVTAPWSDTAMHCSDAVEVGDVSSVFFIVVASEDLMRAAVADEERQERDALERRCAVCCQEAANRPAEEAQWQSMSAVYRMPLKHSFALETAIRARDTWQRVELGAAGFKKNTRSASPADATIEQQTRSASEDCAPQKKDSENRDQTLVTEERPATTPEASCASQEQQDANVVLLSIQDSLECLMKDEAASHTEVETYERIEFHTLVKEFTTSLTRVALRSLIKRKR